MYLFLKVTYRDHFHYRILFDTDIYGLVVVPDTAATSARQWHAFYSITASATAYATRRYHYCARVLAR
jgi:glucuronate isomerase